MASPTLVTESSVADWDSTTSPKTIASIAILTDDIVVVLAAMENGGTTMSASNTGGAGMTFTQQVYQTGSLDDTKCAVYIWTAIADGNKTIDVTVTRSSGTLAYGFNCQIWRNSQTGAIWSGNNGTSINAPVVGQTAQASSSAIPMIVADWTANGAARAYNMRDAGSFTETDYDGTAGVNYMVYAGYYPNAGPASAKAIGITTPPQNWVLGGIEIKVIVTEPVIVDEPQSLAVIFGNAASFTVNASSTSGDALSYQWTENGANVGTNASSYTTSQTFAADQNAAFAVSVWDTNGTTQSLNAYLRLTVSSGKYAQESALTDYYQLEDASGVYIIEPWGGTTAAVSFGPFWLGPVNGLGTSGRFHKSRLH